MPYKDKSKKVAANARYRRKAGIRSRDEISADALLKRVKAKEATRAKMRAKKLAALAAVEKTCSKCGLKKSKGEFQTTTDRSIDGLMAKCKVCMRAKYRYIRETDKWRARYKELYAVNREKHWAAHIRRREMKIGLTPLIDVDMVKRVVKRFDGVCFKCKASDDLTIDHHNAMHAGHIANDWNCVLLCRSCNSRKEKRIASAFYDEKELGTLHAMGIVCKHGIPD